MGSALEQMLRAGDAGQVDRPVVMGSPNNLPSGCTGTTGVLDQGEPANALDSIRRSMFRIPSVAARLQQEAGTPHAGAPPDMVGLIAIVLCYGLTSSVRRQRAREMGVARRDSAQLGGICGVC